MVLKLRSRELPTVEFRRVLPEYLGPDGAECFIQFEARAGGAINSEYQEAIEGILRKSRVDQRKLAKEEDDEAFVKADISSAERINVGRFAAMYDTCVIGWNSNIQTEDDKGNVSDITCDRETFLALCKERVPEIGKAIIDLEKEIKKAGVASKADDDDTIKN